MQRTLPGGFLKGFTDEGAFAPGLKGWLGVHQGEGNGTPLQYFAWRIPWMEEPGGLQSMGSLRVGHDWATSLSLFTFMHWRRKWQPTPVFLPGESQGRGSLVAAVYGVTQSRTRLKWLSSSRSSSKGKSEAEHSKKNKWVWRGRLGTRWSS